MFLRADARDLVDGTRADLPPPALRYLVGGSPDAEEFALVGKLCATDIQSSLRKVGREIGSFNRILDFGCGCGRTLVHIKSLAPKAQIAGTDINEELIEWCRQHLNFATFSLNRELPPSDYAADTFDFIYAVSVFTHLDEDYQLRWLAELQRIVKPGGILLLTVNGLEGNNGFTFERSYEEGLFPAWYQNSYQSRDYVSANFGRHFKVLDYFQQSMNAHQDVVVLEKPWASD